MFDDTTMESTKWKPAKAVETIKQEGDEKLVKITPDAPWAFKYLMGVPDEVTVKMITRKNFPQEGLFAFAVIPFDIVKNQPVE